MDATAKQGGGARRTRRGQRQHSREGRRRAGGGEERGQGAADGDAQTGAGRYAASWICRLNSQCDDADVPGKSLDVSRHLLITLSSDVLSHSAYTKGAGTMGRGKWGGD